MERTYAGNHGAEADGWVKIGETSQIDGVAWSIYRKPQQNDGDWVNIKIVANGRVTRKANYWLSWNGKRFGKVTDYERLEAHRIQLKNEVEAFMEAWD